MGILCESVSYGYQQQGRGILCGIGINLAQPQSYFDAANLPNGTSLALQGANVDLAADPAWLAEGLTDFGFDRNLYTFARDGFAPFREEYKAACVNLGRRVTFDLPEGGQGAGEAIDVDEEGRLWCAPTAAKCMCSPAKYRCTASTARCNMQKEPLLHGGCAAAALIVRLIFSASFCAAGSGCGNRRRMPA